jgi:hypothetical protein
MKAVAHADGLIVWKTKSNGDFLTYQWIFDSHANRDSTIFILDLRRSTPNENRGYKRKAVLSRLRYGLEQQICARSAHIMTCFHSYELALCFLQ